MHHVFNNLATPAYNFLGPMRLIHSSTFSTKRFLVLNSTGCREFESDNTAREPFVDF